MSNFIDTVVGGAVAGGIAFGSIALYENVRLGRQISNENLKGFSSMAAYLDRSWKTVLDVGTYTLVGAVIGVVGGTAVGVISESLSGVGSGARIGIEEGLSTINRLYQYVLQR